MLVADSSFNAKEKNYRKLECRRKIKYESNYYKTM